MRSQPPTEPAAGTPATEWPALRAGIEQSIGRLLAAAGADPHHPATKAIGRRLDAIGAKLAKA